MSKAGLLPRLIRFLNTPIKLLIPPILRPRRLPKYKFNKWVGVLDVATLVLLAGAYVLPLHALGYEVEGRDGKFEVAYIFHMNSTTSVGSVDSSRMFAQPRTEYHVAEPMNPVFFLAILGPLLRSILLAIGPRWDTYVGLVVGVVVAVTGGYFVAVLIMAFKFKTGSYGYTEFYSGFTVMGFVAAASSMANLIEAYENGGGREDWNSCVSMARKLYARIARSDT